MSELVKKITAYQAARGGHHRAGTLSAAPLERIEWYFKNYFKDKPVASVETGCGASSIVFATYAQRHTAYTYDDRDSDNSSVSFATEYPDFNADRVKWVFGPTQRTIFADPLTEDVDIILIDGPHGYPFPELEYFAFYKHLKPGGILIVDDIHIPSIYNFYKFLMQDDGFRSHGVSMTTAYFQRTDSPAFNMEGDDWWLQRYNVQGFPAVGSGEINSGVALPVQFDFNGKLNSCEPLLTRGFSLQGGRPVTEGAVSAIDIKVAPATPKKVRLTLDIEPVCVQERIDQGLGSGFRLCVGATEVALYEFADSARRTIEIEADTDGSETLHVEFWSFGLVTGNELVAWEKSAWYDARLPNFWLHSFAVADATQPVQAPNHLSRVDGSVVSFDYAERKFRFLVDEIHDSVQNFHACGRFYELEELELLRKAAPPKPRILEVGAHVGNHTVFFSAFLDAERIVPIEPNARAQASLRINCLLNNAANVDLSRVDHALGAECGTGSIASPMQYSSGSAFIALGTDGPVKIVPGDELFPEDTFDLIKIDVEGMEIDVLRGLAGLIQRCRPVLFVEVKDEHDAAFQELIKGWGYSIATQTRMYPQLTNYLATHGLGTKPKSLLGRLFGGR